MNNNIHNNLPGGIHYLLQGFKLIFEPGIKRYLIIPMLINFIIFAALFALNLHYLHQLITWLDSLLPSWLVWLNWILWVVLAIGIIIILTYVFTLLANLIGAPFNGLLSEKIERQITGKELTQDHLADFIKSLPRSLMRQLKIISYYLPKALLCLVLFIVPIVHSIAWIFWFLLSAWMMTLQYVDYPMDNHHISFDSMRDQTTDKRALSLGFGCAVMIISLIPILNFIIMPAAVAGATLMYVEQFAD